MAQADNEAVFRRFYEDAWNKGDLNVVDELLAADFVNHALSDVPGSHREHYKLGVVETRLAYWVTARWRARGTHTGELEGVAPTGKSDEIVGTTVVRLVGGKIVELWKH